MESLIGSLNWLAVTAATLAYFFLGALWYSPVMFANLWMKLRGLNEDDIDGPNPKIFIYSLILQAIAVFSLALFISALDITRASDGAFLGFVIGAGFVFTTAGSTGLFTQLSMPLHFLDNGYHVIGLTIAGLILGVW